MSKISASMGLNVAILKGERFDRFTPSVSLDDIDASGDVDAQIKVGLEDLEKLWKALSDFIEKMCSEEVKRAVQLGKSV